MIASFMSQVCVLFFPPYKQNEHIVVMKAQLCPLVFSMLDIRHDSYLMNNKNEALLREAANILRLECIPQKVSTTIKHQGPLCYKKRLVRQEKIKCQRVKHNIIVEKRKVKYVDRLILESAAACGLAIQVKEIDGTLTTGNKEDEWSMSKRWTALTQGLHLAMEPGFPDSPKSVINEECEWQVIGKGTYNIIVSPSEQQSKCPASFSPTTAIRFNKPINETSANDQVEYEDDPELSIDMVIEGVQGALFASLNGVGAPIQTVVIHKLQCNPTENQYGTIYAMERAKCDFLSRFFRAKSKSDATLLTREITDLVHRASMLGIAFFDIKPANILCYNTVKDKDERFMLSDCDPTFFFVLQNVHWKSLFLLNLTLLSAHMVNMNKGGLVFDTSTTAWSAVVTPVLLNLTTIPRDNCENSWIFEVPAVRVNYRPTNSKSRFELQRFLCAMTQEYFWGPRVSANTPTKVWKGWNRALQPILNTYWENNTQQSEWPCWPTSYVPLIEQLVEFVRLPSR